MEKCFQETRKYKPRNLYAAKLFFEYQEYRKTVLNNARIPGILCTHALPEEFKRICTSFNQEMIGDISAKRLRVSISYV